MRFSKLSRASTMLCALTLASCAGIQISATPITTQPSECERFSIVHTSPGGLTDAAGKPLEDGDLWTIEMAKAAHTIGQVRKMVGDTSETKFQVLRENAGWHAICDAKNVAAAAAATQATVPPAP